MFSYQRFGPRSGRAGAIATPSALVGPVQAIWFSRVTIDTVAPSTGSALSRRVTNTSVFCGLSFTVRPRLVTWTTVARVFASSP